VTEQVQEGVAAETEGSRGVADPLQGTAQPQVAEIPVEEITALREDLEKAQAQAAEYLDGWQRARAELANARKRFEKERSEAGQLANSLLIVKLLPALDDMERAIKTMPDDLRQNTWTDGVVLIQRKLQAALESEGAVPIPVNPGDKFNPAWHEAVTHEENAERGEGEIIAEVQKGYRYGEQVLRPALVRVAK
jgi:molecular chaperone GrpE